jgi:hypothetical protein
LQYFFKELSRPMSKCNSFSSLFIGFFIKNKKYTSIYIFISKIYISIFPSTFQILHFTDTWNWKSVHPLCCHSTSPRCAGIGLLQDMHSARNCSNATRSPLLAMGPHPVRVCSAGRRERIRPSKRCNSAHSLVALAIQTDCT